MPEPLEPPSNAAAAPTAARALAEHLPTLLAVVRRMDHAQDAQLEATRLLREEVAASRGLLAHLIQILTPDRPEPEGPSFRDLLALVIRQQSEIALLLKQTLGAATRIETRLGAAETPAAATLS